MSTALRLLAFGLQLSFSRAVVCSPPYRDILGVCLYFKTEQPTYCEAQAYCSSVGGELVRGSNYLPLNGKTFPGSPYYYWIGLSDLLHERRSNKSGWRWTDGALTPSTADLQLSTGNPGGGSEDCVLQLYGTGQLGDISCSPADKWKAAPMCQPRSLPSAITGKNFDLVAIPVGLPSVEFADGGECSKMITGIEFIECSILCVVEPKDWCVSFYFNEAKKECRLLIYTDATVNMGDARGWKKYAMRK